MTARRASAGCTRGAVGQDVDEVTAGDHVGGGEVFEGLALGGVAGVDAAVDPDAQEDVRLDGLDRAADVGAGVLPSGDGVGLVGPQDIEARGGGVAVRWDVAEGERAAGVGVGAGVVERGGQAEAVPGEREGDAVGGEGTVGVRERGDQGEGVAACAGRASVEDSALTGPLEEVVRPRHEVGGVHVEAADEFEQNADGQVGEFCEVDLVLGRGPWRPGRGPKAASLLIGLDTAAANGNHGGRPPAVDGDMLAVALRRRDANEPVTSIARHLGVGRSTLYPDPGRV